MLSECGYSESVFMEVKHGTLSTFFMIQRTKQKFKEILNDRVRNAINAFRMRLFRICFYGSKAWNTFDIFHDTKNKTKIQRDSQ